MTDFTPEQEAEIQKRIEETKAQQQWAIAGDRATRLMVIAASQSVSSGSDDPFVLNVAEMIRDQFVKANFTQPKEAKDEVAEQD